MVVLSWNSLAGVIASYAIGRVIGMLIRFAIGTQNNGAWGSQIAQSLRSIGIDTSLLTRRVAPYVDSGVLKATLDDDVDFVRAILHRRLDFLEADIER